MDRHLSLQTYVPRPLADWIKGKARDQQVSVSIVIRDQLIDAWQRENEARKRPAALDPVRQNLFITVALDALLASHTDGSLRPRTHEAYNRRLARLGPSASTPEGGRDEAYSPQFTPRPPSPRQLRFHFRRGALRPPAGDLPNWDARRVGK